MYHASQQTVSADGLQHNSQHRKMRGVKIAICAPSIRPDLCIWSRGFSGTCRRASLTSFRGCDPHVVDIVWVHGEKAPALPEFVVLRLEGYTGPVWSSDPRYEGCLPIAPFETSWSTMGDDRGHETRQQVPLALCWAITMHKSQGQTMDKAVVDLGKSESKPGLTFVRLSRAKRLVDLPIEPMPLERLSKISDTPTFQLRLLEEVRLNALAGETLRLHEGVE